MKQVDAAGVLDIAMDGTTATFPQSHRFNQKDFELLVNLNVFNESLMNDAVYKFKRYEDASLEYSGVNRHLGDIGLYSTTISRQNYEKMKS